MPKHICPRCGRDYESPLDPNVELPCNECTDFAQQNDRLQQGFESFIGQIVDASLDEDPVVKMRALKCEVRKMLVESTTDAYRTEMMVEYLMFQVLETHQKLSMRKAVSGLLGGVK